jgi:hypothetical protein
MRRLMCVGVAVVVSCLALSVKAQDSKSEDQSAYKVLAKEEGVWDADIKMMVPGADGKVARPRADRTGRTVLRLTSSDHAPAEWACVLHSAKRAPFRTP